MQAAVMIHRMPGGRSVHPCAAMLAAVVISQNAWVLEAIPMLSCTSCCHDPQNALVEEGVIPALPCKLLLL
jgi:hypothetical protein